MSQPTYCLHKLQAVLADFLDIDKSSLPDVRDILKQNGYIGVQKGEEIEYFSKGLEEFGTNYPQYYHKPQEAIAKLLETQEGQVAGAFYRQELGDIDLVWGNENLGLQKIIEKHLSKGDFKAWGEGEEALIKGLSDIVENGELLTQNNVNTIILHKDNNTYRLGISKGWFDKGENNWIITAYKVDKSPRPDSLPSNEVTKSDGTNLHSNDLQPNSTTNTIDLANPQAFKMQDFAIDSVQDFNKWAEFVGIKVPAKKRQETYKYIKNSIKAGFLEC